MALPNDSVLVTPGSGATAATHTISSKEYEVWMSAGADGHIRGSRDAYVFCSADFVITGTPPLPVASLWNGSGSGVIVEVPFVTLAPSVASNNATTGSPWRVRLIDAEPTGGSTRTAVKLNSASAALPSQVVSRFGAGGLTTSPVGDPLYTDMANTRGDGMPPMRQHGMRVFGHEPIVLEEDEGIDILLVNAFTGEGNLRNQLAIYLRVR